MLAPFEAARSDGERAEAEARIWDEFGRQACVFVLDLAGFTQGVSEVGLVRHLARVDRLLVMTQPIIHQHGGHTVKHEADNCFAAFDDVAAATSAAEDCLSMLVGEGANGAVGIAWGPVLFVGDDYYGYPVNIASKLGEDLARGGEILIEATAGAMLSADSQSAYETRKFQTSGVELIAMARWRTKIDFD